MRGKFNKLIPSGYLKSQNEEKSLQFLSGPGYFNKCKNNETRNSINPL